MIKDKIIDRLQLKYAVRLVIAGWLFDAGEIDEVPEILEEIKNNYEESIKEIKEELKND